MSVFSGVYWIKNKPFDRKIDSYKLKDEGGEISMLIPSSRSGVDGEVFVSLWNETKIGKRDGASEGNDNVLWLCRKGWQEIAGGLLNNFSLYSSMLTDFLKGLTIEVRDCFK